MTSNSAHNNNNGNSSDEEGDEQLARDMQMAYDLQAKEELKSQQRRETSNQHSSALEDGFSVGSLNADHMLFVSCWMDRRNQVDLLVDTGASASVISLDMVERLGFQSKLNTNICGNAQGVGSSSIVGIVENVECTIGHVEFRLFFMVLEGGSMPYCILGLDQMRRFKCNVDLDANVLVFGGKDGVSVPFLPPEEAKMAAYKMMMMGDEAQHHHHHHHHHDHEEGDHNTKFSGKLKYLFEK